jgi:hypothetical protein
VSDPRTLRQRLVVEIGDAGQARIGAARAVVTGEGHAATVERRYLEGAGFGSIEREHEHEDERAEGDGGADALRSRAAGETAVAARVRALGLDPSAEAVVLGAARALVQIREAAGVAR